MVLIILLNTELFVLIEYILYLFVHNTRIYFRIFLELMDVDTPASE